jgi:hypothetical protein
VQQDSILVKVKFNSMTTNILCLLFSLVSISGICQGTFIRAYYTSDANNFDEAASYGRVCARTSQGYIQATTDGEFIWMDHNGEVVNTKKLLQSNSPSNYFTVDEIVVASNDNFYAFINPGGDSLMVLKLDFIGNILWQKYIAEYSTMGNAVLGINDEIVFSYRTYGGGSNLLDNIIVKLGSDGSVLWENRLAHIGSTPSRVTINGLGLSSDGGILAGGISNINSVVKPLLLKLDSQGEVEWAYTFLQTNGNNATVDFVQELADGNVMTIINAADVTAKCASVKVNESGQVIESRGFVIENLLHEARIESDGSFQAAVLNSEGCFAISATGEVEYANYYLRPFNELSGYFTSFDNILESSIGSIEYYGTRFYPFGNAHAVLVRTYPNGDIEDNFFEEMPVTVVDYSTNTSPISIQTIDTTVCFSTTGWITQDHELAIDTLFTNPDLLRVLENRAFNISLWPNPSSSVIQWKSDFKIDQVVVFDAQGRKVKAHNSLDKFIHVSDLESGLYYLVFIDEKRMIASKSFIKQ